MQREGEAYRRGLEAQVDSLGVADLVSFDARYRPTADLQRIVQDADIVLLPYDSLDQVTSGVLVEAITAGKPVVSTGFPHAVELLGGGMGLIVDRQDPAGIAAALRRILTEPGLALGMSAQARAGGSRTALARGRGPVPRPCRVPRPDGLRSGQRMTSGAVPYTHLMRLSDTTGLFEHARNAEPRREHGYCVDDVARGLVVTARDPRPDPATVDCRARTCGSWWRRRRLTDASTTAATSAACGGTPPASTTAGAGRSGAWARPSTGAMPCPSVALEHFDISAGCRSVHPRAMAFAALGAAEVVRVLPQHRQARRLLSDAAILIGRPERDSEWCWPEPRLRYANAALAEVLIAAGALLDDPPLLDDGLAMLTWLVGVETRGDHLSVTPVDGWSRGEPRPGFDQQPIEVAALADACSLALDLTGDPFWRQTLLRCAAWFNGANDIGVPLVDAVDGSGFDGLEPHGRNDNRGAESTLAMLSTFQQASRMLVPAP